MTGVFRATKWKWNPWIAESSIEIFSKSHLQNWSRKDSTKGNGNSLLELPGCETVVKRQLAISVKKQRAENVSVSYLSVVSKRRKKWFMK